MCFAEIYIAECINAIQLINKYLLLVVEIDIIYVKNATKLHNRKYLPNNYYSNSWLLCLSGSYEALLLWSFMLASSLRF